MFSKTALLSNSVTIDTHHRITTDFSDRDLFFQTLDAWEKQATGSFSELAVLRIKDAYNRKSEALDLRHLALTDLPKLSDLTELRTLYLDKNLLKKPGVLSQLNQQKNLVFLSFNSDPLLTQTALIEPFSDEEGCHAYYNEALILKRHLLGHQANASDKQKNNKIAKVDDYFPAQQESIAIHQQQAQQQNELAISQPRKPRDSIANYRDAISLINDSNAHRQSIMTKLTHVFDQLAKLELYRNNRVGFESHLPEKAVMGIRKFRELRDNNIEKLDEENLKKKIDIEDKALMAKGVSISIKPRIEAFCGEHAYLAMDLLNKEGIPFNQMVVISADAKVATFTEIKEQLSAKDKAVISAKRKAGIGTPIKAKIETHSIDHVFLLYSDQPIDQNKPLSEHYQQTLIIIDPWASKKIVELPITQSAAELDTIIRNYFDQVMREVDEKYRSKRTIAYQYDTPISEF